MTLHPAHSKGRPESLLFLSVEVFVQWCMPRSELKDGTCLHSGYVSD